MNTAKFACAAAAFLIAIPLSARADGLMRRGYSPYGPQVEQRQARQGLLFSFGVGGGSLYLSDQGPTRVGAADIDFRLGYGFSDQFQMFMDFNADGGTSYYGDSLGTWTWTVRAQTLLVGDRRGNGLSINFGAGFGGVSESNADTGRSAGPTGFALAGGLSYDARISPSFAISPEFFYTWHQVPNLPGIPDDVSSIYGVRVNLLWYLK